MKFLVPLDLNYRKLLALYQVSERALRLKKMILFRLLCIAGGAWRGWTAWQAAVQQGLTFRLFSYLVFSALFLAAGLLPNVISAAFARMRVDYRGTLEFDGSCFYEVIGSRKIHHNYPDVYAMFRYRGYDILFLSEQEGLVFDLEAVSGHTGEELRAFLEKQTGKPYRVL